MSETVVAAPAKSVSLDKLKIFSDYMVLRTICVQCVKTNLSDLSIPCCSSSYLLSHIVGHRLWNLRSILHNNLSRMLLFLSSALQFAGPGFSIYYQSTRRESHELCIWRCAWPMCVKCFPGVPVEPVTTQSCVFIAHSKNSVMYGREGWMQSL